MDREELNSKLLEAAEKGDTDKIWELIEQGADIDTRNKWGETALMYAARYGHLTPELLEALVSRGADVNARDKDGMTALMLSAYNGYLTPELLEALVSRGADVNARTKGGWTALICSALWGHLTPELLEAFISHGADINTLDDWNRTALMESARNGHLTPELLEAFMKNGADVNARTKDGWTALMYAASRGHLTPELLEVLVSLGADVNARDKAGETVLMFAVLHGRLTPELLEALVSMGADINARNKDGRTALMYVAEKGYLTPELMEAFMKNGADVNARDNKGRTAMSMLCTGYFNEQHVGLLLSFFSCGYSIRNMYDGWTPESFIKWLKDNKVKNEGRTVYALLAALSLYPERNETLDKYVSQKRSAAADVILYGLKNASHGMRENFLSIMSEGRAGALSLSDESVHVLAGMLLEAMDTNPGLATEFIRKRVGKKVETWVKDDVEGANTLVSRLAHRMRQGEFVSEGAGMPDLDLF